MDFRQTEGDGDRGGAKGTGRKKIKRNKKDDLVQLKQKNFKRKGGEKKVCRGNEQMF